MNVTWKHKDYFNPNNAAARRFQIITYN